MVKRRQQIAVPAFPTLEFDTTLWAAGVQYIAGIDEAGRGALAGPVVAAAVILPADSGLCQKLPGVKDSKMMSAQAREHWGARLKELALFWSVGQSSHLEIDSLGIIPATHRAIERAIEGLSISPQHLLLDYLKLPECAFDQTSLVKGDARCLSIACASILAKTARDAIMCQYDREYPGYGFAAHKGYGTLVHRRALARLNHSPIHRRTFQVKELPEE